METNDTKKYYLNDIKKIIIKILKNNISSNNFLLIENDFDFDLYNEGYVDSLDGMSIISDLENEFNIIINQHDEYSITKEFSINKINNIILKYIKPIDYES